MSCHAKLPEPVVETPILAQKKQSAIDLTLILSPIEKNAK
jgi:hypothetical protein